MDFTLFEYKKLIESLINNDYNFITFDQFCNGVLEEKTIVLRHDVDLLPNNSLRFAKIQSDLDIAGTYFFRAVPESWDEKIIKKISSYGHEIGYHYECLTTTNGDMDKAIIDFEKNLTKLRNIAPVSTICMHGSPASKWDSKDLWNKFDYKQYGIIGEPYFDIDFKETFYLTDTGRMWDGYKVSVRDKIENYQDKWIEDGLSFHNTSEIIRAVNQNVLPNKIMMTFHPQRWHNSYIFWLKELIFQRSKNILKRVLIKIKE